MGRQHNFSTMGKGTKGGCCSATGQCSVMFCGVVFQLFGCGLLAYCVYYFIDKTANNLAYCILGLALANILAGIIAFCFAPNGKSKCLMITYVVWLIMLTIAEMVGGIALKVDEEGVKDWLTDDCSKDNSCSHSMKAAESGFDKHQDSFFYSLLVLVGFKLIAILLAVCHNSTADNSKFEAQYSLLNSN